MRTLFVVVMIYLTFLAIMADAKPANSLNFGTILTVRDHLPKNVKPSKNINALFVIHEVSKKGRPGSAELVARITCHPQRLSIWLYDLQGTYGSLTRAQIGERSPVTIAAFRQSPHILVLQDAWSRAESTFSDQLNEGQNLVLTYHVDHGRLKRADFVIRGLYNKIRIHERHCK